MDIGETAFYRTSYRCQCSLAFASIKKAELEDVGALICVRGPTGRVSRATLGSHTLSSGPHGIRKSYCAIAGSDSVVMRSDIGDCQNCSHHKCLQLQVQVPSSRVRQPIIFHFRIIASPPTTLYCNPYQQSCLYYHCDPTVKLLWNLCDYLYWRASGRSRSALSHQTTNGNETGGGGR